MPRYFEVTEDRSKYMEYISDKNTYRNSHSATTQPELQFRDLYMGAHPCKGAVLVAASAELLRSAENSKQFLCVEPLQNSCRDISPDVLPSAGAPNSSTMVGIICAALGVVSCDLWGPTVIYVNSSSYMACTFEATNAFRLMGGGWAEIPSHQNGNLSA
ncbi:hypothetical protein B2J93_1566 [Marssonina coronariae]|uniref:Uncharacterized protein n=1 Tax=Diplocarpon coronariae TaxID=2795749 RepID=A0A218Z332_9HELO|nr:hypothetical protein B2J93_1566 [Marssonina coronariae]